MPVNKFLVDLTGLDLDFSRIQISFDTFLELNTVLRDLSETIFEGKYFMSFVSVLAINAMHTQYTIFVETVQA
jgi:hypothetical protein